MFEDNNYFNTEIFKAVLASLVVSSVVSFVGFYATTKQANAVQSEKIDNVEKKLKGIDKIENNYSKMKEDITINNTNIAQIKSSIKKVELTNKSILEKQSNLNSDISRLNERTENILTYIKRNSD